MLSGKMEKAALTSSQNWGTHPPCSLQPSEQSGEKRPPGGWAPELQWEAHFWALMLWGLPTSLGDAVSGAAPQEPGCGSMS